MTENQANANLQSLNTLSFKISNYLLDYKRVLIFIIPFFLVGLFAIFKISFNKSQAEEDFVSAKMAFSKWMKEKELDDAHLQTLKAVLKKHPEIGVLYEGALVQKMLALGEEKKAKPFLDSLLKRTSNRSNSHYTKFSKTSLLIESGDLEKALERSLRLKEEMLSDAKFLDQNANKYFGSMLFAYNLLRIGMLSQALQKQEAELTAWQELKRYAHWDTPKALEATIQVDSQAFAHLLSHFTDQDLSLLDYIKFRESKILAGKETKKG